MAYRASIGFYLVLAQILHANSVEAQNGFEISVDIGKPTVELVRKPSSEVICRGSEKTLSISVSSNIKDDISTSAIQEMKNSLDISIEGEFGLGSIDLKAEIFNKLTKKTGKSVIKAVASEAKQNITIEPYDCFYSVGEIEYERLRLDVNIEKDGWLSNKEESFFIESNIKYQSRIIARYSPEKCGCPEFLTHDPVIGEGGRPAWIEIEGKNNLTFRIPLFWANGRNDLMNPYDLLPLEVQADLRPISTIESGTGPAEEYDSHNYFRAIGDKVLVRDQPNRRGDVLRKINPESPSVKVITKIEGESVNGQQSWYIVDLGNNKMGYVASHLLEPDIGQREIES